MTVGENSAPQLSRGGTEPAQAAGAASAGAGSFFRQCDSTEPVSTAQSDRVAHQLHKIRYETLGEIGRGGMGAILKVLDRDLSRSVAMKVMLNKDDERRRMRFVEEAQVTGQLEHPNIVPVHEMGFDKNGHPFFTMKLVNGLSLADIMKRLRDGDEQAAADFSMRKLLKILTDVANAISYAHYRGVVHRDLKPANIMVGSFGEVLVMDWGLAKVVGDQKPITNRQARRKTTEHPGGDGQAMPIAHDVSDVVSSVRSESSLNTREGTVAGTPAYMSPEQARGETDRITRRSDVYALGAMLYEVLTLKPPIRSGSARSSIKDAAEGRIIRPEDRAPERNIPSELSAIAMKALSYEPRHRYASMDDFRNDLQRFLNGHSVSAKVDSAWESLVKLVNRNKAASIFTLLGIVLTVTVSVVAFIINTEALHRAERKQALAFEEEAKAKKELARVTEEHLGKAQAEAAASAALVFKARSQIESDMIDEALSSAELAVRFDYNSADARMLRSQILLAKREFQGALADVQMLLRLRVGDPFGIKAQELCQRGLSAAADRRDHDPEIISMLIRADMGHLARAMVSSPADRLSVFRQELEHAWPGSSANLVLSADGNLSFDAKTFSQKISDLRIFRGIPLTRLVLQNCTEITDLAPLHGMPLRQLDLDQCRKITNIAPLKGMPLVDLHLVNCERIGIYEALKDMPLEELDVSEGRQFTNADVAMLARMPLAVLTLRGCPRIDDITPLGSISTLKILNVATTKVSNLEPIRNLKLLEYLVILQCPIRDLTPIAGLSALNAILMPPGKEIPGLKALRQMPRLAKINDLPAQEYWAKIGDIP